MSNAQAYHYNLKIMAKIFFVKLVLVPSRVTRLGDFSPIRLLFVGSLKNSPKIIIPWATNLLHFQLNKLFKKWFLIWHYFAQQLIWLLFKKLGEFFQIIWSPWCRLIILTPSVMTGRLISSISYTLFWQTQNCGCNNQRTNLSSIYYTILWVP